MTPSTTSCHNWSLGNPGQQASLVDSRFNRNLRPQWRYARTLESSVQMPVNFLMLHRDPIRHQYFSRKENLEPFFDTVTKTWIIANPSHCRDLIASNNLRPASYAEDYYTLEQRLGIDFSSLTFAFDHIPLCLHGDRHLRSRRRASEFLATRRT